MDHIPNLFVIGASKCGTTLFHDLLDQHPEIFMSRPKELWHFNRPDYMKREQAYLSFFEDGASHPVRGESTPIYAEAVTFPQIPSAIHRLSPDAKIIYIVREPFSRFRSQWTQTLATGHWARSSVYGKMPTSYRKAVFEYPAFLTSSLYWTNLSAFRLYFPDAKIKVLLFEDLVSGVEHIMKNVFAFLQVDTSFAPVPNLGKQNSGAGKSPYSPIVSLLRRALPSAIRDRLPANLKYGVRDRLISLTAPHFDHADLSSGEKEEVCHRLKPEVARLYEYLGIVSDPWEFFGARQKATTSVHSSCGERKIPQTD